MVSVGDEIELTIEKPVAGGRMIARHQGQVVLVSGAIPGERVRARVERLGKGLAFAETVDVLERDVDRRDGAMDPACGGSAYAHIRYSRQLALKSAIVADAFARIARVPIVQGVPVAASVETGYRMRARVHVRGERIGFFREGTHEVCDAASTGQLLPDTGAILADVGTALRDPGLSGIDTIEVAENLDASQRVLHLELRQAASQQTDRLAELAGIRGVTGITCGAQSYGRPRTLAGSPFVSDPISALLGRDSENAVPNPESPIPNPRIFLRRHAAAFFQANRYLLSALVSRVCDQIPHSGVVDLYAGVGLFACALAAAGRDDITAVEGDPVSADDLRANAACWNAVRVRHMSVERFLRERGGRRPHTGIVDPPRTGMSRDAAAGILEWGLARVVYVSCDVATLARDARRLLEAGYSLAHVEAFDFFPNTAHLEALAVFDHSGSGFSRTRGVSRDTRP